MKKLALLFVVAFIVGFVAAPAMAAGNSNIDHLYLNEKDPNTWEVVEEGAWGKMKYNLAGPTFDFVFNGHGLEPDEDYQLIYYPDKTLLPSNIEPWPREDIMCLGSAALANEWGDVYIEASVNTGNLPNPDDPVFDINTGAKIWLVLSGDVDCGDDPQMFGWNPTEYLFESNLITFVETDDGVADGGDNGKVTICHIPPGNPDNAHTITISIDALSAHDTHGDTVGACGAAVGAVGGGGDDDDDDDDDEDGKKKKKKKKK